MFYVIIIIVIILIIQKVHNKQVAAPYVMLCY